MNKSTKGAIAAGAAAVLLLGGAGSLAYWNAQDGVTGGTITAGSLSLTEVPDSANWTLNGDDVADITAVRVVPGDELEFTGQWTIGASGDNLEADVAFTGLADTGTLASAVTVTESFTVEGAAVTEVTDANDGNVLEASVVVDFPFGAAVDNASQGGVLNLADGSITLTQTDATP